ncbi:hypothetical protein K469DRAFT_773190 [Zopfia rhizophila CBS 207.26]|uniref:Uncharacterized protein n=1 Tax=Zopfia rhizophila CBS 207.26 TaxID=1314779 RepID=A0A6A6EAI2_9PEZI|nr:hypothetical protein K469DRAFT_773190 [Zopfia rhizophila CBS 207.26]
MLSRTRLIHASIRVIRVIIPIRYFLLSRRISIVILCQFCGVPLFPLIQPCPLLRRDYESLLVRSPNKGPHPPFECP